MDLYVNRVKLHDAFGRKGNNVEAHCSKFPDGQNIFELRFSVAPRNKRERVTVTESNVAFGNIVQLCIIQSVKCCILYLGNMLYDVLLVIHLKKNILAICTGASVVLQSDGVKAYFKPKNVFWGLMKLKYP